MMIFTIRKSPPEERHPNEDQWVDFDASNNSLNAGCFIYGEIIPDLESQLEIEDFLDSVVVFDVEPGQNQKAPSQWLCRVVLQYIIPFIAADRERGLFFREAYFCPLIEIHM